LRLTCLILTGGRHGLAFRGTLPNTIRQIELGQVDPGREPCGRGGGMN